MESLVFLSHKCRKGQKGGKNDLCNCAWREGGGMLGLRTVEREILTDILPCISDSKINDL